MLTEWVKEIQDRFETDRELFLKEDLEPPPDAHLKLQSLPTYQLCMMLLQDKLDTLTKMRIKKQFEKRRKNFEFLPGEVFVNCLHLIDLKYSLDKMAILTPAQLISVGMKPGVTDAERLRALDLLTVHQMKHQKAPKKAVPVKRSQSPNLLAGTARAKAAKRSHSPDQLASRILPPRPIAPSPDSELPSLAIRPSEECSGLMAWVRPGRFAQAIWDPRLYYRQIDFAMALEKHIEKPKDLVSFSPAELKALKFSPNRDKLPDLPREPSSGAKGSGMYDREVKEYLYKGDDSRGKLSWLLTGRHPGLEAYISALQKVARLREQAEKVWERLESEVKNRVERFAHHADPIEEHARLVQLLKDDAELADFFFPDDKPMDYPLTASLRKQIGDGPFWRLKDLSKMWNTYDH